MTKITMNLPDDILEKADKRSKQLGISRTAFITMTISEKLMQSELIEGLPEMLATYKKMTEKAGE